MAAILNKIYQTLISLGKKRLTVDPAQFGDPVAEKTAWGPARSGGASFCTRRLKTVQEYRVVFRPTFGAILFFLFFTAIGAGTAIGFTTARFFGADLAFGIEMIIPLAVGVVFAAVGIGGLISTFSPIVFDRLNGYFWKGRKNPTEVFDATKLKTCVELGSIHALQIISEFCRSNKSSYYSYELNLVLDNGERINVVDHGSLSKLRHDAQSLAEFLDVPVWDAA